MNLKMKIILLFFFLNEKKKKTRKRASKSLLLISFMQQLRYCVNNLPKPPFVGPIASPKWIKSRALYKIHDPTPLSSFVPLTCFPSKDLFANPEDPPCNFQKPDIKVSFWATINGCHLIMDQLLIRFCHLPLLYGIQHKWPFVPLNSPPNKI